MLQVRPQANMLYVYARHSSRVTAVVWSPDGKYLASASYDKTVQIWHAANGVHVMTCLGHFERVQALAWSPDSKCLVSGSDDGMVGRVCVLARMTIRRRVAAECRATRLACAEMDPRVAGFHALNFSMFELAHQFSEEGMPAYSRLQQSEFAAESHGYTATRHQHEVGTGYFDEVMKVISSGQASTTALDGSTEAAQF